MLCLKLRAVLGESNQPKNDLELWLTGTYAIWGQYYTDFAMGRKYALTHPIHIGGCPRMLGAAKLMKKTLKGSWDITDYGGILETVEYMSKGPGLWNCSDQGGRAWELCRSMQLLGCAYLVGWCNRKELLRRFGSIRGVLDARPDELLAVSGFGPGLLSLWQLLRELMTRYQSSRLRRREEVATPEAVARLARTQLAGCPHEECWLALLNGGNFLIGWERLRQGNVSTVPILPRDVLELALLRKARGIIVVHNHPGGQARPSQPDLRLTQGLDHLAPQMGLRLVDHVIVTENDCYSILQGRYL